MDKTIIISRYKVLYKYLGGLLSFILLINLLPIDGIWRSVYILIGLSLFLLLIIYFIKYEPNRIEIDGYSIYVYLSNKIIHKSNKILLHKYDVHLKKISDNLIQLFNKDMVLIANIRRGSMLASDWEYFINLYPGILAKGSYLDEFTQLIYFFNKDIIEIKSLKIVKTLSYTEENLTTVISIIKSTKLDELEKLKDTEINTKLGDLILVKFYDQTNNIYFATIYDSNNLWQNPRILEIYPIKV